ncbi:cache domain-containing protein, partial [Natronoarchaeum mannanilyticum]
MQLRRKFLLAFVLVALTIAGVLVVTFDSQRDAAVASASEDATEQADLAASTIDRQLVEKRQSIEIAADHPELVDADDATRNERIATIRTQTDFEGVSVVAANGTMTALANEDGTGGAPVGEDFSDRPYVRAALDGRVYVSDPFTARTGNRIVVVSAPIRSDGEIVGTLNGAFHLSGSALFDPIEGQSDPDTQVRIVNDGTTLYAGDEAIDSTVDGRAIVHTTGWTVTVDRRQSSVTAQVRRLAVAQGVAGIVMLGAVALFGLWIYRSDIRQAERLRDQFRRIEAREYDRRVELTGSTEWSEIGASVNRLTETLARREQMLLVLNRLLRHNLRNSLNVIVGRADLIDADDDRDDGHAAEIRSAAEELLHLSGRARKTEALITDDRTGVGTPVDVADVVRERVAAFRTDHPDAAVEIEAPEAARASIGGELATVVDELLANTVDHAGPAPNVRV